MTAERRKLPWKAGACLAAILLVAVVLRGWGLGFGLPYLYHPDEPDKVAIAQRMFVTGDLNPHYFKKPTLFLYANAAAYVPYYLVQRARGALSSPADLKAPEVIGMGVGITSQPSTMLLGRSVTLLMGLLAVLLVFGVARMLTSDLRVGLLAALFLAVSPTAVMHSRYISVDMFLVCAVLVVAAMSLRILDGGGSRYYVVAGAFVGIAAACKYPGALSGVALLAAHFLRTGPRGVRDRRLYLGLLAAPVAFLLVTPYALLDFRLFFEQARYEADHYTTGHAGMEGGAPLWYALFALREEGLAIALGLAASALAIYRRDRRMLAFMAYPLAYVLFISLLAVRNDRTFVPALPFLLVAAAALLVGLWSRAREERSPTGRTVAGAGVLALVALALAPTLARTASEGRALVKVDSRATAAQWIDRTLPVGSTVAIESYAPFVDPRRFRVLAVKRLADQDAAWFESNHVDYAVFSQGMYERFFLEPARYPDEVTRYRDLFGRLRLVREFRDGGYVVLIFDAGP